MRKDLGAYEKEAEPIEQRVDRRVGTFDRTQGHIAQMIVWLFVGTVVGLIIAYLVSPFLPSEERVLVGVDKARELANTLLLPVVTLVLGYYFGRRAD